jgi:hypothetical protein
MKIVMSAVAIGLIGALAGCGLEQGTGRLAQYPGLEGQIMRYYERANLRDDPRCRSARFEGVTQSEVISEDAQQLVLEIRFYYAGGDSGTGRRCRGFGQRTVTVDKTADGFEVVGMSDPLNR